MRQQKYEVFLAINVRQNSLNADVLETDNLRPTGFYSVLIWVAALSYFIVSIILTISDINKCRFSEKLQFLKS